MNLFHCVSDNDVKALKTLIARGANVNAVDGRGRTALWWAAEEGRVECATALIDAKADVDKGDKYGNTPLHLASNNGHAESVRVRRRLCVDVWNTTDVIPFYCSSSSSTRPTRML
jgi:ankyrin repeat protein